MTKQELESNEPLTVREALEMAWEFSMEHEHREWDMVLTRGDGGTPLCQNKPDKKTVVNALLRRIEAGSVKTEEKAERLVVCNWARWCGFECKDHHKPHKQNPISICTRESECVHIGMMVKCMPVEG